MTSGNEITNPTFDLNQMFQYIELNCIPAGSLFAITDVKTGYTTPIHTLVGYRISETLITVNADGKLEIDDPTTYRALEDFFLSLKQSLEVLENNNLTSERIVEIRMEYLANSQPKQPGFKVWCSHKNPNGPKNTRFCPPELLLSHVQNDIHYFIWEEA
jgi:hypothetical protein